MHAKDKLNIGDFWVAGINYKKTDAELRGKFAVNSDQYSQLLQTSHAYGVNEFFVLSTCNRTEIYGFAENVHDLASLLCSVASGDAETFSEICYLRNGGDAVAHLFHVGAGLDSQILGDYEILGQIKTAVKTAKAGGCIGAFTERLVNSVLQASKAIRTHTALSGGTVSVSFAAVQYIREFFEGPVSTPGLQCPATLHLLTPATIDHYISGKYPAVDELKIVLIGTGKIGKSTCRNLVDYLNTRNITLINRTEATAAALAAELGLKSAPMSAIDSELAEADVILVSTSSAEPVVIASHLAGKGRKLVIDFSIPCNVSREAQQLPSVKFVDVDMLSKIKDETLAQRRNEIPRAAAIIAEIMEEFMEWCAMRRHVPMLRDFKDQLKTISETMPGVACEKIQKTVNSLALKIRKNPPVGCHFIEAFNEYLS